MRSDALIGQLTRHLFTGKISLPGEERDVLLHFICNDSAELQPLSAMASALRMSKSTLCRGLRGLENRGYLTRRESADAGNRKRHGYTLAPILELFVEVSEDSSPADPVLPSTAAATHKKGPSLRCSNEGHRIPGRSEIVECARKIERVFEGRGGFVPYRELNEAVERFILERGMQEFSAFADWLLNRHKEWRKVTVGDFPTVCDYWEREKPGASSVQSEQAVSVTS
jgi:DNA-binding Lrp family transcriptional regulator